jgi:hypothetical protein
MNNHSRVVRCSEIDSRALAAIGDFRINSLLMILSTLVVQTKHALLYLTFVGAEINHALQKPALTAHR